MPLNERFLPCKGPQATGEKGTPYALPNGLGRFFVARERLNAQGQLTIEYTKDERGRLELAATLAIRRTSWGADDDKQWYPVTYTVANLAFADTKGQYVRPQRGREGNQQMKRPSEYQEQLDLERLALLRHPDATGVKEIQPVLTPEKQMDMWFLILTTPRKFHFYTELVTPADLKQFQEQQKEQQP